MRRIFLSLLIIMSVSPGAAVAQAQSVYERYPFSTLAGASPSKGSADGPAAIARFNYPSGVALDGAGNVYVADQLNRTIRKVTPAGSVSTVAGAPGLIGTVDGPAKTARFTGPTGVAVDNGGNVYVADKGAHTIRKITSTGMVSTFVGLANTPGTADDYGTSARVNLPGGLAVDSAGNIFVADSNNHAVRKITPAGLVSTVAGLPGTPGSVDGSGSTARFSYPQAIALDLSGNLYVADTGNQTIRKITGDGNVTTLAGLAGAAGSTDGAGSMARFNSPYGISVDSARNIYVAEFYHTIRKITPAGVVTTLAGLANNRGSVDGLGSAARFDILSGIAVDGGGQCYVGDSGNNTIRKVTPDGYVSTLAGTAVTQNSSDGQGAAAGFFRPIGAAVDGTRNVYVGDNVNCTIRKITPEGLVSTFAGRARTCGNADGTGSAARFSQMADVAVDTAGNVYVADTGNQIIRKITPTGVVSTFAGLAGTSGSTDGLGSAARFFNPQGVAVDGAGNVYVGDTFNNTLRKISPAGLVTTLAGRVSSPGTTNGQGSDDGLGSAARFFHPFGVAVDNGGNLYVADTGNGTIRKVTPAGLVSTFAGMALRGGSTDGTGSAARFYGPEGVAVDTAGNLIVTDTVNHIIRKITPAGVVTTIAGLDGGIGSTDGAGSAARFRNPSGVAIDNLGYVYVADANNSTIRIGGPAAVAQPLNISTRLKVDTGDNVLIGGFVLTGSVPKKVVLRGIGPSLSSSGIQGSLSDPTIELYDASGGLIASNDDWKSTPNASDVRDAGIAPSDDRESAIVATLTPNQSYTAVLRGKAGATGIAVVEAYDLNPTADALLANLSTRGFVETGNNVMIGGFILGGGNGGTNLIVRALGPSLTQSGISNVLPDPTLELHDGNGSLVAANDNWKETNRAALEASGIAPTNDLESAVIAKLPSGPYTAIVAGKGGGTGVGLVEFYNLP